MKNIKNVKISEEGVEHIASLIGSAKIREEDGRVIVTPANNEELSAAVASAFSHGCSVTPLSKKGSHTDDGGIRIRSARAQSLYLYNMDGTLVQRLRMDAGEEAFIALPAGKYIVGGTVVLTR